MMNEEKKPREYDLVLGGNNYPPVDSLILGGIEGIKHRLKTTDIEAKITALCDALKYGDIGLDLIVTTLANRNNHYLIKEICIELLQKSDRIKDRLALQNYAPWLFFDSFDDWKIKRFTQTNKLNINDNNIAYSFEFHINDINNRNESEFRYFDNFINQSKSTKVKALVLNFFERDWNSFHGESHCNSELIVSKIISDSQKIKNIKFLFIGNIPVDEYHQYPTDIGYLDSILDNFPKLQFLHIRSKLLYYSRSVLKNGLKVIQHKSLKTLIVETYDMGNAAFYQISKFDLPRLEYLELWLSGSYSYWGYHDDRENDDLFYSYKNNSWTTFLFDNLMKMCESFPNLKYLGLRSLDDADLILEAILDSPLIEKLSILNLSRGTLTDRGAELLLQSPAINQLYILNVSENLLSDSMIRRLSKLNCKVIAESQYFNIHDRYNTMGERYCSLWE